MSDLLRFFSVYSFRVQIGDTLKNFEGNETSGFEHTLKVYLDVRDVRSNSPGSLLATNCLSKGLRTLCTRLLTTHLEAFRHRR